MTEYIDREKALDIFGDVPMWQGYYESYPWEVHCAIVEIVKLIKEEISKIPTSDVTPVVHGRFVHDGPVSGTETQFAYCPACGAKIDGKDEDDV